MPKLFKGSGVGELAGSLTRFDKWKIHRTDFKTKALPNVDRLCEMIPMEPERGSPARIGKHDGDFSLQSGSECER